MPTPIFLPVQDNSGDKPILLQGMLLHYSPAMRMVWVLVNGQPEVFRIFSYPSEGSMLIHPSPNFGRYELGKGFLKLLPEVATTLSLWSNLKLKKTHRKVA